MNVSNNFDIVIEVLEASLEVNEPWYIKEIKFDWDKEEFVVDIGIQKKAVFPCPRCGRSAVRYGFEPTERSWRHVDCLTCRCYVHCRRPRVKCEYCGVLQVTAPFERKHSRHTRFFESYALRIMEFASLSDASSFFRCSEKELASINSHNLNES